VTIPRLFSSLPSHYTKFALLAPTHQRIGIKWMASYGSEKAACCLHMRLDWTIGSSVTWMDLFLFLLKMEAAGFSKTPSLLHHTTWCHIPEDSHLHSHQHDNLKSHITYL
jgi:hypothetical protein